MFLVRRDIQSKYIYIDSIKKKLGVVITSWIKGYEVRGTIPREALTLLLCRKCVGVIQSPAEEWSRCSRMVGRLLLMGLNKRAICVSETTKISASRIASISRLQVEYAKLAETSEVVGLSQQVRDARKIVFIVMDGCLVDKGYLRHLSIVEEAISSWQSVVVEAYGKRCGCIFSSLTETTYNGFVEDPFGDAMKKHKSAQFFYLGCSRYEGLHMAVVEAAQHGIPSILSDIAAHRELQMIGGVSLLIGKELKDDMKAVERAGDPDWYEWEVKKSLRLARKFRQMGQNSD